jgi:hypothetical protein
MYTEHEIDIMMQRAFSSDRCSPPQALQSLVLLLLVLLLLLLLLFCCPH